jgi:hypothetical protein
LGKKFLPKLHVQLRLTTARYVKKPKAFGVSLAMVAPMIVVANLINSQFALKL